MRLALISGPSSCGKTTLSNRFRPQASVLRLDTVVRDCANRACPYLRQFGSEDALFGCPDLWATLDHFADTWSVVQHVVDLHLLKSGAPRDVIIAESYHLRLQFWHARLLKALGDPAMVRSYRLQVPLDRHRQQGQARGFIWTEEELLQQESDFDATCQIEFDLTGTPEQVEPDLAQFLIRAA